MKGRLSPRGQGNDAGGPAAPLPEGSVWDFPAPKNPANWVLVSTETKVRRKPPRGGHRAAMRRDTLLDRIKLAAIILIGVPVVAYLIYLNLTR
jgi:hypothetical protein